VHNQNPAGMRLAREHLQIDNQGLKGSDKQPYQQKNHTSSNPDRATGNNQVKEHISKKLKKTTE
jgi:hypothetical protein